MENKIEFSTKKELLKQIEWCAKIKDSSLLLLAINKYGKEQREIGFMAGREITVKSSHGQFPKPCNEYETIEDFEREVNGKNT